MASDFHAFVAIGRCCARDGRTPRREESLLLRTSIGLRPVLKKIESSPMKFALAILVYLLIGLVLSVGIVMLMAGKPWVFVAGLVGFLLAFAGLGCVSH